MPTEPTDLRVEHDTAPLATPREPRFSWRCDSDARGAEQAAYHVRVARSPETLADGVGDAWDSGWVASDRSIDVASDGGALAPDTRYHWTVRVRDENGEETDWAEPATFVTAPADLPGEWIGHQPEPDANGWRSRWHESDFEGVESVTLDLGEVTPINEIALHPTNPFDGPETPDGATVTATHAAETASESAQGAAGFGFPAGYRIDVATDESFADPTVVTDRVSVENPGDASVGHDCDVAGRYVRVTATDLYEYDPTDPPDNHSSFKADYLREEHNPWTVFALAGLSVCDDDGEDREVGSRVEATSSVETATWSREFLVDSRDASTATSSSPLLRTEFDLQKPIAEARLHVSGLGYGEWFLNGERVGDAVLEPGWTEYDERVPYATHDVTALLEQGTNAIGLWLGRGWFAKGTQDWTCFGSPRGLCDLRITYEDGTTRRVRSDGDWRATASPIVANDIYDGERYDARREAAGWAEPGFDDADWDEAATMPAPGGELRPQVAPPSRVTDRLAPDSIEHREEGTLVDFGQNVTGWVALEIEDPEKGQEIEIRHAENLLEDGTLNTIDLRSADATDTYVARGDDVEHYHPRFTYHGFRFAEIRGYPGQLDASDIEAHVVHTDMPRRGEFDCANDELTQVQENATWGLRGNAHSVPTDCPQRDERFGWTGDGHISARAFAYNFDARGFHEKWSLDHDDVQSPHGYVADTVPFGAGSIPEEPTWAITRVTIPWHLYRHDGDRRVLERHYDPMRRYVEYWLDVADDGVMPGEPGTYGDWLAFECTSDEDERRGLPHELFNTAFLYHTTTLFARMAEILGNEADARRYHERATSVQSAFHEAFFDGEDTYGPGTQSSYAVPLFVGLVPEEHEDAVAAALAEKVRGDDGKLKTGFLGTRPLLHVLCEHGYEDLAYHVVSQPERPGWVYMVRNGATAMWERWDSDDRVGDGMNSFNHSPFTFISEWLFARLAGIEFAPSLAEGVEIAPAVVEDLPWAEASIDTPAGTISSRWEQFDERLEFAVTIPWNTNARIEIPAEEGSTLAVDGETVAVESSAGTYPEGVDAIRREEEHVLLEAGSGEYGFEIR